MRLSSLLFFILALSRLTSAQTLHGTIKDSQNNPIPYATVFIKELNLGTSANIEGRFELKLSTGSYSCIFQSMGFQTVQMQVNLDESSQPLEVILPEMTYSLPEVEIHGIEEDPAYRIMRNVIAKAPYYSMMVKSFDAEVYIKGSLLIRRISNMVKLLARKELKQASIKEGDIYLEESVNEIQFKAPDIVRQKVKSVRSNFPDFGDNQADDAIGFLTGNIYSAGAFGKAYSPFLPGAFTHYQFRHEGKVNQQNLVIHKIAVIPRGKGAQYMKGTIYIVDSLWSVSNLDLAREEQMGVAVQLIQNFNEVQNDVLLPVSNRMIVDFNIMDNSGLFNYHTSIKYKKLDVNPPDFKNVTSYKNERVLNQISRKQQKIDKLSAKDNISTKDAYRLARLQRQQGQLGIKDSLRNNHEYIETYKTEIDKEARLNDASYWSNIRPIPLTGNELFVAKNLDTVSVLPKRLDSLVINRRSPALGKLLIGGLLTIDSTQTLRSKGLINPTSVRFNVVDGFTYATRFNWEKKVKNLDILGIQPMAGYAFSRKKIFWDFLSYWRSPKSTLYTGLKIGQQSFDYNPDGVQSLENTIDALFFRENISVFYHSSYINFRLEKGIFHGLTGIGNILVAENSVLQNKSDFSFFFKDAKDYRPNIPVNPRYKMYDHRDLTIEFTLRYQSMPYYYIKDGVKVSRPGMNNTPVFSLSWKKGIPSGSFVTDYDLLSVGIEQKIPVRITNQLNYNAEAGYFYNDKNVLFPQFQHFSKRPLVAGFQDFYPYFLLIKPYLFSTNEHFIVGHLHYKSPYLLIKRLPVLRNKLWNESIYFSYLYTPQNKHYMEPGYGIGNILFTAGVFAGFNGTNFQQVGLRFSILLFASKEITL